MGSELEHLLASALDWMGEAARLALQFAEKGFDKKVKMDSSLVTEADLAIERYLRQRITSAFPDHGIVGEEFPNTNPSSPYQWIIDPIDGTQNFARGIPTYGTIIGLHLNSEPQIGVVNHPALGTTFYATKGGGAFRDGARLTINDADFEHNDVICVSDPVMFNRSGDLSLLARLADFHPALRIYHDIFATTLTAANQTAALVEMNVRLWDLAASQLLIEEAGGVFKYINRYRTDDGLERFSFICGRPTAVRALHKYIEETGRSSCKE